MPKNNWYPYKMNNEVAQKLISPILLCLSTTSEIPGMEVEARHTRQ